MSNSTDASLRSDEPIHRAEQDQLARTRLVDVIGKHILETSAPESVVIALNAPWGAGKTSFLNLLERRLVPEVAGSDPTPIIVRFNPWNYGNIDQLVAMFFAELARGVGTARKREIGRSIGQLLKAAGSIASLVSSGVGGLMKEAGDALESEKSLAELKSELDSLLPELDQPVIVFVDDIDRLERDALRLLFRMIRLNADFANVTYVLAFDRLVVERNLDEPNGIRGRDYLEKIVQVSFDVPAPEPSTLFRILFGELDATLTTIKTRPLDQHRWGNVFHSGFKDQFRTIRQIKRYVNGLRLTLPAVALEVDLVDFLGVELLRVFHPEVYAGLVRGKDMLMPPFADRFAPVSQDRLRAWLEGLCASAVGFEKSVAKLLQRLFPGLERAYRNVGYHDSFYSQWRRDGRVCSPEVFDKFFLLSVPTDEVSEVELQAFLDRVTDRAATKSALEGARQTGKARRLLERLEDYTDAIPVEVIPDLVAVLFDEGDSLRFESRGAMDFFADMQLARVIYQCLERLPEVERVTLLETCASDGLSLGTVVHEVALAEPSEKQESRLLTDRGAWERIRDIALTRIEGANASGELWTLDKLQNVLFRWREWTDEAHVRDAVAAHIRTDQAFLDLIAAFADAGYSHGMGDMVGRKQVRISKKNIACFMDADETRHRLVSLAEKEGDHGEYAKQLLEIYGQKRGAFDEE